MGFQSLDMQKQLALVVDGSAGEELPAAPRGFTWRRVASAGEQ